MGVQENNNESLNAYETSVKIVLVFDTKQLMVKAHPLESLTGIQVKNDFILIYKCSGFAESKEAEFELRNAFKKYELHASYMTKRKFKVMAKADQTYRSLSDIHNTLSHAAFVVFVHPTEECKYKEPHEINELITLLKKEQTVQNEEIYFVAAVINNTCISQEQMIKLYAFNEEIKKQNVNNWFTNTISQPTSILSYTLNHYIAAASNKKQQLISNNIINKLTSHYLYI